MEASVKEIIKEFAMEIADLKREAESWKKMYSDLYTEYQDLLVKQKEQGKHLNIRPSYEDLENALLTEQEENGCLRKELDRVTALLKERDAEIV